MMNFPSLLYVAVIAVGGFLVVWGNIQYPIAREREKNARLANDAWAILQPELQQNKKLANEMSDGIKNNRFDTQKFSVSAWETVSKGGMLTALKAQDIHNFLAVYNIIYQANVTSAQLIDSAVGLNSVMTTHANMQNFYKNSLQSNLDQMVIALDKIEKNHSLPSE
jgi:hypothetical protein